MQGIHRVDLDGKNATGEELGAKIVVPVLGTGTKKPHDYALEAICGLLDVAPDDVRGRVTTQQVVKARTMWATYAVWTLGYNMREAGRRLGLWDTTVRNALNRHDEYMAFDTLYRDSWIAIHGG